MVSPARLQAHSTSALVYTATALGGAGWAKMALALALSVIASTGTGIVIIARLIYSMASHRVLPGFLANVSPRFSTPVSASVATGLLLAVLAWLVGKSMGTAPAPQLWSLAGILVAGLTAMLAARFGQRSAFFTIPRESDTPRQ